MSSAVSLTRCLRCTRPSLPLQYRAFSHTPSQQTQQVPIIRRKRRDPYAVAQAKARKAANKSRQQVLLQQRAENLGDPVRGIETDFVRSFDNPPDDGRRNFFLKQDQLMQTMNRSQTLNTPSAEAIAQQEQKFGTEEGDTIRSNIADANQRAEEAMRRISSLQIGSSKDRHRVNVQRCITEFGRHNTDTVLAHKPSAVDAQINSEPKKRVGEDTGSPEVQIAILTARIRTIATNIAQRGSQDKYAKRNLRLLVHRRQKQLQYLQRRERGGPRWQNTISALGLTEGTWKGEITLPR